MRETDWTRVLGWPGYRVYRHEIKETAKTLKLWVRRKRGKSEVGVFRVRAETQRGVRHLRAGGARSALLRVSHDGGDRALSGALPGLRGEEGEGAAIAEQGAFQQAL